MEPEGNTSAPTVEPPRGMHDARLDDKGRLKVPSVLQKYLDSLPEKKLYVTSLDRRTAAIYPISVWRTIETFFENFSDDPVAAEDISFNASDLGEEVEMDPQGRILFNTKLRRDLKLEGSALHLYVYRGHIEVMPDELYLARQKDASTNATAALTTLRKAGMK